MRHLAETEPQIRLGGGNVRWLSIKIIVTGSEVLEIAEPGMRVPRIKVDREISDGRSENREFNSLGGLAAHVLYFIRLAWHAGEDIVPRDVVRCQSGFSLLVREDALQANLALLGFGQVEILAGVDKENVISRRICSRGKLTVAGEIGCKAVHGAGAIIQRVVCLREACAGLKNTAGGII